MNEKEEQMNLFELEKPVIKGYPELRWTGKRPYTSTQYFPAQLKESYGKPDSSGWINKIFWGDNLQVMSHLLKEYRGKVDLIYIDPPFDSKADYKKKIKLKGKEVLSDSSVFEEKQYGDIWTNDEYLQFMYERLVLLKELLSDSGSIFIHCDWHRNNQLRCLMDEIFGPDKIINEIVWCYTGPGSPGMKQFNRKHDIIYWYSKGDSWTFNEKDIRIPYKDPNQMPRNAFLSANGNDFSHEAIEEMRKRGRIPDDWWEFSVAARKRIDGVNRMGYPTEKPEPLIERIIKTASNKGDLILDCFMGSGTTQAVALKTGRRFIGADINLGSVQTTTKRLLSIYKYENSDLFNGSEKVGFQVYNVNNYDFFRNPIEAKDLLIKALEIQPYPSSNIFDGEKDGRNVKILPVNRIATKFDLNDLVANLPYSSYEKAQQANPNEPVDRITLVCMGHEPDLKGAFLQMVGKFNIDVEIVDILRDKTNLEFKRDSEADIEFDGKTLTIKEFFPMNLLQKLSLQKENVENWKQLVDSVLIDYNYDGAVLNPQIIDVPEKNDLVKGVYSIPSNHGKIKVKITDLLSESLEKEVK